ncbi:CAAX prenyl protease-related protein [Isosphaera pallida ATCC 43644]|uniref:CAAX prenyl protease-related protein n=1 Tax=Isosphaera pallida (strain ATCC 43644 / DSM 9630 / IS1B) TaxID=575540 RepID=E8R4T9_ISOPI|nr:CAAX prenyl protease-related protein [Isosphaera pallida]ADV61685.1 CAAX prenyl protease-related protein [Isosphaera pallida ATCC 43644]
MSSPELPPPRQPHAAAPPNPPSVPAPNQDLLTWFAYAAPMLVFLVLTQLESWFVTPEGQPDPDRYPWLYTGKLLAVGITLFLCRSTWRDYRPLPSLGALAAAIAVGLTVATLWVGLDGLYPIPSWMGTRSSFDPEVLDPTSMVAFITVRLIGLALIVPFFEELFWRSLVVRFVIDPDDFTRVPVGRMSLNAALVSTALFAAAHPEWLPALITGLLWAGLLDRTGSLSACLVSHVVANLALGCYVVATGSWHFW